MSTSNQTLKVNPDYWHNKRYSKDEIKRIQSALNKQALGKQIAVDGIFGKETLAAIKNFQTQHSDILKVDGLVGDQTLSALGITNIADASLPQTRPGQNQSRGTDKKPKGMSDADYEYQKNYYNSPEMISYLMNATNANTDPGYTNHYYNALNFVSPEIASKLRALNNEGDAYDRGNTYGPHIGINRVKSNKEGGLINKVQYFKKGNTMQQQDIKQKVKDLVQLAMQQGQEAEQANQLIQSIFEKAKQGDPQSVQLAQLIQAELQQVQGQGQTAYAKFGSKLDYIRSLKYAKGGKTCPACEAKQQMIAQQACGGKAKKAKKRYFGGWL